jgi:hypothetical protein
MVERPIIKLESGRQSMAFCSAHIPVPVGVHGVCRPSSASLNQQDQERWPSLACPLQPKSHRATSQQGTWQVLVVPTLDSHGQSPMLSDNPWTVDEGPCTHPKRDAQGPRGPAQTTDGPSFFFSLTKTKDQSALSTRMPLVVWRPGALPKAPLPHCHAPRVGAVRRIAFCWTGDLPSRRSCHRPFQSWV